MGEQLSVDIGGGQLMPLVGFGTWNVTGADVYPSVRSALDAGYRHIDTAYGYNNEDEIGRALADSGIPRDEVFLTTKIPSRRVGFEARTLEYSLTGLRTDYVDLWLIHNPPTAEESPILWQFLIDARDKGQAKAIGVSSYSTRQIDAIIKATGVTPAVNQIRWSPEIFDRERMQENRDRGIRLEGFSAIRLTDLNDPTLMRVANAHGVTGAQVLTRWQIEHGVVNIPRSTNPGRIRENFDVWDFELTPKEVALIDAMSTIL